MSFEYSDLENEGSHPYHLQALMEVALTTLVHRSGGRVEISREEYEQIQKPGGGVMMQVVHNALTDRVEVSIVPLNEVQKEVEELRQANPATLFSEFVARKDQHDA